MLKNRNPLTKRIKRTLSRLGVILITVLGIGLILTPTLFISQRYSRQNNSKFKAHWFGQWDYTLTSPQGNLETSLGVDGNEAKMQVKRGDSVVSIASPLHKAEIKQQDDYVIYKTANDLINIKYQPLTEGIKEEIILNADPQITTFVSKISLSSVEPRVTTDGQIVFVNPEGEYQFHIQPPFAQDATGDITYDLKYRILEIEKENATAEELSQQQSAYEQTYFNLYTDSSGRNHVNQQILGGINPAQKGLTLAKDYYLVLEVDPRWIQSPDRLYPITIDPTIVHDESSEFSGQFNRVTDTGSGLYPSLETYYQELPADEHTVGLWHMNEGNDNSCAGGEDACDSSGNGNHGTATGTTISTSGKLSNARSFNGSSDYISLSSSLLSGTTYTIEGWFYSTDVSAVETIFSQRSTSSGNPIMGQLYTTGSNIAFITRNDSGGNSALAQGTTTLQNNTWYYVAGVRDGSNVYVYLNGILEGTDTDSGGTITTDTQDIGRYTTTTPGGYLDGYIDEVRISNIARTPEEIKGAASRRPYSVYTSEVIDLSNPVASWGSFSWEEWGVATGDGETLYDDTGLVAQWNFNETSGTTADNATGSCGASCDGTLSGFDDTTGQDADPDSGWTANSRRWGGGALQFDGVDSYVYIPHNSALNLDTNISIEAWVRPADLNASGDIILAKRSGTTTNYELDLENNDVRFVFYTGAWNVYKTSGANLENGKWYHIVATYDESTAHIYINGKEQSASWTSGSATTLTTNTVNLDIGRQGTPGNYFTGTIDSIRLYSRILTAHEVMSNYNAANIQFQTRVGDDASPDDGDWEAWSPATSETKIQSFDSDAANWSWDNTASNAPVVDVNDPTTYYEGSGSLKLTTGAPQVDANTVALWHFDETNGDNVGDDIFDATNNNNDGEFNGSGIATAVVDGVAGRGREFNGSDDYISIPSSSVPSGNEITISFWAYGDANLGSSPGTYANSVFEAGDSGGNRTCNIHLPWTNDNVYWDCGNSGTSYNRINKTANASDYEGRWTHWAFTKNATAGTLKIYLNGELWHSGTGLTYSINPGGTTNIGAGKTNTNFWPGKLDEFRIDNVERSSETIAEWYRIGRDHYINKTISSTDLSSKDSIPFYIAADRPGSYLSATIGESAYANYQPDANTVGLWHLDEQSGSGAYIKDASGNGNDGTPTGTTYTQGKIGKGRDFNGSNEEIVIPPIGITAEFTKEAWIRTNSVTTDTAIRQYIYTQQKEQADPGYHPYQQRQGFHIAGDRINCQYWTGSGAITLASAPSSINMNEWYHIACSGNSLGGYLYINGKLVDHNSTSPAALTITEGHIGRRGDLHGDDWFNGIIDEVRDSNIARSAIEIRQAYEVGRRTHPITIDFAAYLDSGNLISSTSDTSFTIDATSYGLSDMGSGIYLGDKIIVRETVDDTEYIAQGTVTSVNSSTGAVTVSSWDTGSTAPSGGYTVNASVFKWQREYWPIADNTLSSFMDGITNLTFRVTDGNEGRTIWLDDLKSTTGYLTTDTGSTITSSTGSRYFQYRAIMTSLDEAISATLSAVTLDYLTDTAPSAPTSLLTEGQTNPVAVIDSTPEFSAIYNDADPGDIANKYQIQVDDNADFSSVFWDSGANGTSMSNCIAGNRCSDISYSGSALTAGTTYYWRIKFWDDDDVEGAWSSGTNTFSINKAPNTPSLDSPLDDSIDQSLSLSLKTTGTDDDSDYLRYKIELCEDLAMSSNCQTFDQTASQTGWSGQNAQSNTAYTSGTQATYTLQTPLNFNTTYYWRSYAIDPAGINSWSGTQSPVYSFSTGENDIPNIPTLDYPANGAENVISTIALKTTGTDNDSDYLRYKIELCEDLAMSSNCQTFDQTASQTGWSGQNAQSNTAYSSGTQATYTIQSMLTPNTTYYWRSYGIDPGGMNTWSSTQTTPYSFTTSASPLLASGCRIRESRDDSSLTVVWADLAADEDFYEVERSVNSGGWGDIATGLAANTTSYQDTDISNGNTYRYRVAPYYIGPVYGDWCYTDTLSISTGSLYFNNLRFD